MNAMIVDLLNVLKESLLNFYKYDAILLKNNNHEQAIVHRIAYYFENILKAERDTYYITNGISVDVEYNRNGEDSKTIFKKCLECPMLGHMHSDCAKMKNHVLTYFDKGEKECRPDLIIHQRGTNNFNLLIVEFKKRKPDNSDQIADIAKLRAFTCDKGEYRYKLGCYVVIEESKSTITPFLSAKAEKAIIFDAPQG